MGAARVSPTGRLLHRSHPSVKMFQAAHLRTVHFSLYTHTSITSLLTHTHKKPLHIGRRENSGKVSTVLTEKGLLNFS